MPCDTSFNRSVLSILLLVASALTFSQGRPNILWAKAGHAGSAMSIAYSQDGHTFASCAGDSTAKLWTADGKFIRSFALPYDPSTYAMAFTSLAFSPDGTLLAVGTHQTDGTQGGDFGTVQVWRLSDGAVVQTLTGFHYAVSSISFSQFSPNGQWLVVCSDYVHVYRTSDWALIGSLSDQNGAAVFSPDSKFLVLGGSRQIEFWRMSDGTLQRIYDVEIGTGITALAFSRDGREFAYGRADATLIVARNPYGPLPIPSPSLGGG